MRVFNENSPTGIKYPVVTLGIFDGVHRGHAMLLERLREKAAQLGGESVVVTFAPHPRLVLQENPEPLLFLTSTDEKITLLRKLGVDNLVIINFTRELSRMTACEFLEKVLFERLGLKFLVIGFDHRFGSEGSGDIDDIIKCSERLGFGVERVGSLETEFGEVSSTAIRNALALGDVLTANRLLGYTYFVEGNIVSGRKLGTTIGFPTANVRPGYSHKLLPGDGVYVVKVRFNGREFGGMANIGTRPTVNISGEPKTVEVHIFDFNESIYDQSVTLSFIHRLRDEMKFPSVDDLRQQLGKDKENATAFLSLI